jgi:hypothetical protein
MIAACNALNRCGEVLSNALKMRVGTFELSGLVPHAFLALCPHEGISNLQRGSIAINGNCGCQIHFLESHHHKKGPLVGGPSPFGGSFSRQEPPKSRREVGSISIRATGTQVAIGL